MSQGPKGDAEGKGVVGRPAVGRHVAPGDRVDVGRIGSEGDPIGKHGACSLRGRPGEVGEPEHEAVEPDRSPGVAYVGEFGEAVAGAEHGRAEADAGGIDAAVPGMRPKPLVPAEGPVLGPAEGVEVDASAPVVPLGCGCGPRHEEIGERVVVAPLLVFHRIAPVLQADVARGGLGLAAANPAIRPDLRPRVGLVAVGPVAQLPGFERPLGLVHRLGMELLGEAVDRRLAAGVATLETAIFFLHPLEILPAGEGQHFAPFRRVDEHRGLAGPGIGGEPERLLREPIRVGRGVPVGEILRRQPVVAAVRHCWPRPPGDAGQRRHAAPVGREFDPLHDRVEKHGEPRAGRRPQRLQLPRHEQVGAEAKPAHPAVGGIMQALHQGEKRGRDVGGRAGHGSHAVGIPAGSRLDRVPGLVHGRHAARRELAADPVGGLDQRRPGAALRRGEGGRECGGAAAGHDDVELIKHLRGPRLTGPANDACDDDRESQAPADRTDSAGTGSEGAHEVARSTRGGEG